MSEGAHTSPLHATRASRNSSCRASTQLLYTPESEKQRAVGVPKGSNKRAQDQVANVEGRRDASRSKRRSRERMTLANSPRLARERVHEEVRPGQHSSHRVGVCQGGESVKARSEAARKVRNLATSLAHFCCAFTLAFFLTRVRIKSKLVALATSRLGDGEVGLRVRRAHAHAATAIMRGR